MNSIEYRSGLEFRITGRRLEGIALRYGEPARDRDELFLPGSLAPVPASVPLNLQHDQSLQVGRARLEDGPAALRMNCELHPDSGAWSLVQRGALGGLSIEFRARQERLDGSTRVLEAAELVGLALVDSGAYATEVEARVRTLPMSGLMRYDQTRTIAQTGRRRKRRFGRGWADYAIKSPDREIVLQVGRSRTQPGTVIASKLGGTLRMSTSTEGVAWATRGKLPETQALRELREQELAGIAIASTPIFLPDTSREDGGIRIEPEAGNPDVDIEVIESAVLTGIALYPAASPEAGSEPDVTIKRRARLWLI